jgi:hypothetical protein
VDPFPFPELRNDVTPQVVEATQAAIDATATAYTEDARTDVEDRLRRELDRRDVEVGNEQWLAQQARLIREGRSGQVVDPVGDAEGPDAG